MENVIYGKTWSDVFSQGTYRDLYENNVWKRQVYIKTKKIWKDIVRISPEGCFLVNRKGKCLPIYKVYWPDYASYSRISFFAKDPAWIALMDSMDKDVPAFRYWCQKLDRVGNASLSILSVMMLHKDIPETESMLMMVFRKVPSFNPYDGVMGRDIIRPEWAVGMYLTGKEWGKKNHSERKALINAYRGWIEEVSRDHSLKDYICDKGKRVEDILLRRHEPDFIVEDKGTQLRRRGVYLTNRDIEWVKRTFEEEIRGDKSELNHYTACYLDWMEENVDNVTDIRDPYFRRNRNFMEEHEQYIEERNQEFRLAYEGNQQELKAKETRLQEEFRERYAKYTDKVMEKDGWRIYITNDIDQWRKRADALRQCIVSCSYYTRKDVVLIFIDKGNTCRYTAEYKLKTKKIGQFYGDERPRSKDLHPTQEVKDLVKEYIAKYL